MALAVLEQLVHLETSQLPPHYRLLGIDVPADVKAVEFTATTGDDPQRWGDEWLAGGETVLARVPSSIVPHSSNWLINPAHPDMARISIGSDERHPFDPRLAAA